MSAAIVRISDNFNRLAARFYERQLNMGGCLLWGKREIEISLKRRVTSVMTDKGVSREKAITAIEYHEFGNITYGNM